jgi:hypothetical protein
MFRGNWEGQGIVSSAEFQLDGHPACSDEMRANPLERTRDTHKKIEEHERKSSSFNDEQPSSATFSYFFF